MSPRDDKIFLVGNPNVGKSVLFGELTGNYTTVSNYPGTTVTLTKGHLKESSRPAEVVDTPGLHSLSPFSEEERVTKDLLLNQKGIVVLVADAKNLLRSLQLILQLQTIGVRLIVALNMHDEALRIGLKVDAKKLEALLGVPVVTTVAIHGIGIHELKEGLWKATQIKDQPSSIEQARQIFEAVVTLEKAKRPFSENLGRWAMHPVLGWGILAIVLEAVYLFVGKFGAGRAVDFVEKKIFGKFISPAAVWLFDQLFKISDAGFVKFFHEAFVGPYGLITMGLSYGLAIVFPIVTTFFIAFSLMEDSGYLPRLAVMVNRFFQGIGLNGKAVLPMVLGLGCDTMATLTTRILETKKQRLMVTLLLALAVPCSAQLGVLLGMFGKMPSWAFWIWLSVIGVVFFLVGFAANKIIPGEAGSFVMEIPPLRLPQLKNVVRKTLARLEWYVKEAIPLFLLGTFILFLLDAMHLLQGLQRIASPLVVNILGLPPQAANAFLIGFLRRDYGATGFFDMYNHSQLTNSQALVALVVITLFVPCVANVFMIIKEHGMTAAVRMVGFIFPFAFLVGGILHWMI